MIHAYNEYYLELTQRKLGSMFEIAHFDQKLSVDEFAEKFIGSKVCNAFEEANPIYIAGKSANELLGIVLNKEIEYKQNMYASPEYWLGFVLAYVQWHFNKPFKELIEIFPCSKLLLCYFPYHEMDISHLIDMYKERFFSQTPLHMYRKKRELSQSELSKISGVSLRSIKAYEQGKLDISKASYETLYKLAKALSCSVENLVL